ncbi:MAG: PaaI family thioesterase [Lachnospiraceae bacterium]|nr:PaaI family thioesterase [Lachnospiraceae bacterium]
MNMEQLAAHLLQNEYCKHIGLEIETLEPGYAVGSLALDQKLINPLGTMHGGVLFSLADIVAGFAATAHGYLVTTISGDINYVNPAVQTKRVICEAKEVRYGSHIGVYDVEIKNDNGNILCKATFSYFRLEQKVD